MSNTVIQLKRSSSTGNVPGPGDINYGELALNYADGKLYYKKVDNSIGSIYTANQYETVNVNGTLLVPTTPSEILSLAPSGGITLTSYVANDTIVIGESLTPTIAAAFDKANAVSAGANAYTNSAISSNVATLRGEISANATSANLYTDSVVSANVATLRGEITSNTTSTLSTLNSNISANVATLRGEITANAESANSVINTRISANVATLRGEITVNTSSVFGQANAAYAQANTAYATGYYANTAWTHANAAYDTANTKFSASGGTISGSVTITQNLTVTGNLVIGGNTTTVQANNLIIDDSIIYVANNNQANVVDIGIVGSFTQGIYQHTGLVRDASDGKWKLFSNVATEPTTTITFDANTYYDALKIGQLEASGVLIGSTDVITYIGNAFDQANLAFDRANAVSSGANAYTNSAISANVATLRGEISANISSVFGQANAAFAKANSSIQNTGGTINGDLTINGTITQLDTTVYSANTSLATVSQTAIDSFTAANFRTAKYTVQITDNVDSRYHSTDILLIHNGTTVQKVEYAVITTSGELGTFDADINTGSVRLLFTATNANSKTIKYVRTLIET